MSYEYPDNPNRSDNTNRPTINSDRDARRKANIARIEELYGNIQFNSNKLDNKLNNSENA